MKKLLRYTLILFFLFAGSYHFINPGFYLGLIPDYLPFPKVINYVSGILEIVLAIGVFTEKYRKIAAYGTIVLLIVFIPSHVYFIQMGSCIKGVLCVSPCIAWLRLLLIHPLLMLWVWKIKE